MPAPACAYSRPVVAVHVVRVFVGPGGRFGNSLGVVLDGGSVLHRRRQALATELGFSETVYVDDAARSITCATSPGSPARSLLRSASASAFATALW